MGVGHESSWPAIRAILEQFHPQLQTAVAAVNDSVALFVQIEEVPESLPFFTLDSQNKLAGARFPPCRECLRVEHQADLENLGNVHLHIVPELQWERTDLTAQFLPVSRLLPNWESHAFDSLEMTLTLKPGEFIIIGPSHSAQLSYLVGSQFLRSVHDGQSFEETYCILPRIVRKE